MIEHSKQRLSIVKKSADASSASVWYCPMHCEGDKTYDKPGKCPVCGMNLVMATSAREALTKQAVSSCCSTSAPKMESARYECPMHCEGDKTYDQPGDCPVCGMHLVKLSAAQKDSQLTPAAAEQPAAVNTGTYYCPMHCEGDKTYDKPGDCPVCGMHLVKLSAAQKDSQLTPVAAEQPAAANTGTYYCPMHCEGDKTYDKPGDCPVCGMHLVKTPENNRSATYTCPMHPEIQQAGPGNCPICGMDLVPINPATSAGDSGYRELLKKFKIALAFTIPLFIISMSGMLPGQPLLRLMRAQNWDWLQLALSLPVVFYAGWMFFERAWRSIVTWNLNMFTLIGIGSGIAFLFSITALFFPAIFPAQFKTADGSVYVYFEAVTVILTLVLAGQLLEARAHTKTNAAIEALMNLVPPEAILISEGVEQKIAVAEIREGNRLRIRPGGKIPVDGVITEGTATLDESMITGESVPVDKVTGDKVISGTVNSNTSFIMEAEKVGSATLLAHIIQMVNDATRSRAPIQNLADKVARYFVPAVVLISILTFFAWVVFGPEPRYVYGLANAVAVLIIACPCALGLATPMSVMVGVGRGAVSGVLVKNAAALEELAKVDTLVIDKTGTLTEGKPTVEAVKALSPFTETALLVAAGSLNQQSEHPLATAVVNDAKDKKLQLTTATAFKTIAGKGVTGQVGNQTIAVGNLKMMEDMKATVPAALQKEITSEASKGKTISLVAIDGTIAGYLSLGDKIKPSAASLVEELKALHIRVIMLTGDNPGTAEAVASALQLSGFKAGLLPADKLNAIKTYQQQGSRLAMAGDGINDAPALAQANVGIAMGTGTDAAIASAGITLVKGDLKGIVKAITLSKAVMRNIRQNLFFAFAYNLLGIPVAAGLLFPFFGILLSPMIAAAAMSVSSVSVIGNALRLKSVSL